MNAVLRVAAIPFKAAWTAFLKSQSPVEQDKDLLWFVDYKGHEVHRRPVMSSTRPGWVESWIPDPDECRAWDKELAKMAARQAAGQSSGPPVLPSDTAGSSSGVNPAMMPGL